MQEGGRIKTEDNDLWTNMGAELEPIKGWVTNVRFNYNNGWKSINRTRNPLSLRMPMATREI